MTHDKVTPPSNPQDPGKGSSGPLPWDQRATQIAVANGALTASTAMAYGPHGMRFAIDPEGVRWFLMVDIAKAVGGVGVSGMRKRGNREAGAFKEVRAWIPNTVRSAESGWRIVQAVREAALPAVLTTNNPDSLATPLLRWFETLGV